jgi:CHAT domain-containing protein
MEQLIRLYGRVRDVPGAEALHVSALLDVVFVDPAGTHALRAIQTIQAALEIDPGSPSLLSDLAAAHLVRAEHGGSLLNLQQAVEACERALELDPGDQPALFNLALALDHMALDGQAAEVWKQVAAGPPSEWSREAARRLASLSVPPVPWRHARDSLAADAQRAPQEARIFAVDTLLGDWGAAVLAGDSMRARLRLSDAGTIGEALRRRDGDLSVMDLVRAIHAQAHDAAATRRLARAHRLYGRGQAMLAMRDTVALADFDRVLAIVSRSPVLVSWSQYYRGVAMFYARRPGGMAVFQALDARVDGVRHPALAGRVRWSLGTLHLRPGEYAPARDRFVEAERFFARAGERENWGTVRELEGEALFGLNDEPGAHERMWSALTALRPYRASLGLHNLLYAASQAATARGLNRAALRLQEEGVLVASRQRPLVRVEALLARARTLSAARQYVRAERDVEASRRILALEDSSFERDWQLQQLRFAAGAAWVSSHPRQSVDTLDAVVEFSRAQRVRSRVVAALAIRAEAHLALRNTRGALADLDSAAILVDSLGAAVGDASIRAMVLEKGRRIFDGLLMLHVRAGRPAQALADLERGRSVFGAGMRPRASAASAPAGEVVLDYALVGDTLLIFVVQGHRVWLTEERVDGATLLGTSGRLTTALEMRASPDSLLSLLAALHRKLFGPIAARVRPGTRVVIIADGDLAEIPFAALWDAARKRYLLQDHPLRFAISLIDAQRLPLAPPDPATALFVVDPAFNPDGHPELQRLAVTAAAAPQIARMYPWGRVIEGTAARSDSVRAALHSAGLFHFAGHAVFDPDRPGASFLVLAPAGGAVDRLTAMDVEHLQLRDLRLVVLAACRTQRSATGRSGGFTGLSAAFLAAGAGGVVGSTWRVNERLTNHLMLEFHRQYRALGNAAEALRRAQLALLVSGDPALRSPAAWAGFRYEGP